MRAPSRLIEASWSDFLCFGRPEDPRSEPGGAPDPKGDGLPLYFCKTREPLPA